jgi:hypothetical protein
MSMSTGAEKRIRLIALDLPCGTPAEEIELPSNHLCPEGSKVVWTAWRWQQNCLIAGVYHPSFEEVPPFALLNATRIPSATDPV